MPIVRKSLDQIERDGGGRVDWDKIRNTSDDDITRQIAEDPDTAPELTEEDLEHAWIVFPDGRRLRYRDHIRQKADASQHD